MDNDLGKYFWSCLRKKKVGELKGISLVIHPNKQGHNKGHLHAKYQGKEAAIAIPEGKIMEGNIPVKQQRVACEWVIKNSDSLIEQWNELTNGIKIQQSNIQR